MNPLKASMEVIIIIFFNHLWQHFCILCSYLPRHRSDWENSLNSNRMQYASFIQEFVIDVHKSDMEADDPLG